MTGPGADGPSTVGEAWRDLPVVVVGVFGMPLRDIAERLAEVWGRDLRDERRDLREITGESWRALRDEIGDAALHRLRAQHLLQAAQLHPAPVIVAAPETVEREDCRRLLRDDAYTIWVDLARAAVQGLTTETDERRRAHFAEVSDIVLRPDDPFAGPQPEPAPRRSWFARRSRPAPPTWPAKAWVDRVTIEVRARAER